ncbi:uncharacterized protein TrAtP1_010956 [Trichoderma atroviride]|uniref:uncharacterized protein n=1 Tax=Hypocrea atroviridis TaxID=63577 RepID=UPI003322F138|nr:hypothetical protein TrAtP1_010956 [Trichoderma atroviride]
MDDNERHNGNQTSGRDIDNLTAKVDQIFDMIGKRDTNINQTIQANQKELATKIDTVVDITTTLGESIDGTIEATGTRLGQVLNVAHKDLATKIGELT